MILIKENGERVTVNAGPAAPDYYRLLEPNIPCAVFRAYGPPEEIGDPIAYTVYEGYSIGLSSGRSKYFYAPRDMDEEELVDFLIQGRVVS